MKINELSLDEKKLPRYTMREFKDLFKQQPNLALFEKYVLDLSSFKNEHPGGEMYIERYLGKDISIGFNGTMNNHSLSAQRIVRMLIVGIISEQD